MSGADIFRSACPLDQIAQGAAAGLMVDKWPVLIARSGDGVVAWLDRCPHAGARLSGGRVRRGAILCPLHGARFDLATGASVGAVYPALRGMPVQVLDSMIAVAVPTQAPTAADLPIG